MLVGAEAARREPQRDGTPCTLPSMGSSCLIQLWSTWGHGIGQVHNRAFLSSKHPCQKLNMPPAHSTGRGVGKPSEPPLQPDPWIRPTTLTPYKKKQLPFQGASKQGNLLTHSCSPPATAGALINPCLKKEKKTQHDKH